MIVALVDVDVDARIHQLKSLLEKTVQSHHFNFQHPNVLEISQQLDIRIIDFMKKSLKLKQSQTEISIPE
ncbi:aspartyl-phosphate phosphatase Spo0E family protein [Bacillus sp. UNC438CL73TsuS30]|uniref:aspartyl-phosphate phosphatase Spo0E family protein n=1 Tax=Bacillus sp. UNC438CL73TsuS30 TaxID=1340434 RepID=UPI0004789224|nr:aspartyl-phosphate phosphatase Spo0E family protein [Bacillus sp. UNC438CL73TsuS30]